MKPFLFKDLFEVNVDLQGQVVYFGEKKILVVDNFFKNFAYLQSTIKQFPPGDWKYVENTKNYIDYYDCKIMLIPPKQLHMYAVAKKMVEDQYRNFNLDISPTINVNWFKQIKEKCNDYAWPHTDNYAENKKAYTVLAYLNSSEECCGGTSFFNELAKNNNQEEIDYWGADSSCWEKVGHIDMVPNRLVVFPAEYYHSAYHPENTFYDFPRLTMLFQLQEKCL